MRKLMILAVLLTALSTACSGGGMPDPDNTMGPGDDDMMRVGTADSVAVRL